MATPIIPPVGKAFIIYGTVKAIAADGTERILGPNSPIFAGERIITGPDGSISIAFGDSNAHLDLGRMSDVLIDQDIYGGTGPEGVGDSIAQTEDIQAALEQDPNFDPTTQLPATAAGAGGGGTGARGGGRQIVIFDPDQLQVTPDSGADSTGMWHNFLDPPGGILPMHRGASLAEAPSQPPENPPDNPPDDPPNDPVPHPVGQAERAVHESDLPDGSSPDGEALVVRGTLADLNVQFGATTTGRITFSDGQSIVIDRTGGDFIVVAGRYGNLTFHDDGTWSYTLEQNTLDHNISGQVEFNDQVNDPFAFSATYPDGITVSGGRVLIHVLDDGPSIAVVDKGAGAVQEDALGHLGHGNIDADQSLGNLDHATDTDTVTVHLADQLQFQFGADGSGTIVYGITGIGAGGIDSGLTSQGIPVLYYQNGNVIEGRAGSVVVFTATLDTATGDLVFNLNDQIDHGPAAGDAATIPVALGEFLQVTITDAENGDSATASFAGSVVVTVENDVPELILAEQGVTGAVQEDALGNVGHGNADADSSIGIIDAPGDTDTVTLHLADLVVSSQSGADDPATVIAYGITNIDADGVDSGLTSNGTAVIYYQNGNTIEAKAGTTLVFTATVDANSGELVFNLNDQLDHSPASGDNVTLDVDLGQYLQATVTDYDGDLAQASFDGMVTVTVENDVPTLLPSKAARGYVQEDALSEAAGNASDGIQEVSNATTVAVLDLSTLVKSGADEPLHFSVLDVPDTFNTNLFSNDQAVRYSVDSVTNTLIASTSAGTIFTFAIDSDTGHATFTLNDQLDHDGVGAGSGDSRQLLISNLGQFVQVIDADGDSVSLAGKISVFVENDIPVVHDGQDSILVNETGNSVTGHLDFQPGADDPGTVQLLLNDGDTVTGADGNLTSNGHDLSWHDNGDGSWSAVYDDGNAATNDTVFTITTDAVDKSYTVKITGDLDTHFMGEDEHPVDQTITIDYNVTDTDNDTSSSSANFHVTFDNDGNVDASGASSGVAIAGGSGEDTIVGSSHDDTITGGAGNDTISGGAGEDTVDGGDGNDVITGDAGNDDLKGGEGNDTLAGGAGEDTLDGGAGDDTLHGEEETNGDGADEVTGGTGQDTFVDVNNDEGNPAGDDTAVDYDSSEDHIDNLVPPPESKV